MLFDPTPLIAVAGADCSGHPFDGSVFLFVIGAGLRAQRLPVKAGPETLIGQTTAALTAVDPQGGQVFVDGALWSAVSQTPIAQGQLAEITGRNGLTLNVKPKT